MCKKRGVGGKWASRRYCSEDRLAAPFMSLTYCLTAGASEALLSAVCCCQSAREEVKPVATMHEQPLPLGAGTSLAAEEGFQLLVGQHA